MATVERTIPGDYGTTPYAGMTATESCGCESEDDTEWVMEGPQWIGAMRCLTCEQEVEYDCG